MNDLDDRVRATLSILVSSAPSAGDMPDASPRERLGQPGHRHYITIAAGVISVVGLTATGLLLTSRDVPDEPPPAGQPSAPTRTPGAQSPPPVGRQWRTVLPFTLTSSENEQLYTLWQTRVGDCMADRGFDDFVEAIYYDTDAIVNPLDLDAVRTFGYHEPSFIPENAMGDPNAERMQNDPGFADAAAGCANLAFEQTWGSGGGEQGYTAQTDTLLYSFSNAIDGFDQTPEFTALAAEWSRCMADRGYTYATPSEAVLRFADANSITSNEIDTRTADAECDRSTGLTGARSAWEADRVDAWLTANEAAIRQATAARRAFLDAAL